MLQATSFAENNSNTALFSEALCGCDLVVIAGARPISLDEA